MVVSLSVPSAGLWGVEPPARRRDRPRRENFQYPLRAYGVWNLRITYCVIATRLTFSTLCGPMGCGTAVVDANPTPRHAFSTLCGPMGCGTQLLQILQPSRQNFQYPLRAYGVWNSCSKPGCWAISSLSVPSAGLWGVEHCSVARSPQPEYPFSTLCGPMGCGTTLTSVGNTDIAQLSVPSAGLWGVEHALRRQRCERAGAFSTLCGPMGCGTSWITSGSRL